MTRRSLLAAAALLAACAAPALRSAEGPAVGPSTPQLTSLHERHRLAAISTRRFTHAELWTALEPFLLAGPHLRLEELGRSVEGRGILGVHYGSGPVKVLLWSQMHGDESTATLALADLVRFLAEAPHDPLAQRLGERLTITLIPMLNPDGAERFQRRNAQGIDINRDARALATPEGRILREAQRSLQPHFGFNLHDQDARARVGRADRTVAISLLAPPLDATGRYDDVRARARQVAVAVRQGVAPLVAGHITRYDETFNPRAFGDAMQGWGTSTILIESGGWRGDPEKQYLRQVNFVGLLTALDAIATGAYADLDPDAYDALPENGPSARDLLIRGGTMVLPGTPPYPSDFAVDYADPLARMAGRIVDAGDLAGVVTARDTLDATGLFLHPLPKTLEMQGARAILPTDAPAHLVVRRGVSPESDAVWRMEGGALHEPR